MWSNIIAIPQKGMLSTDKSREVKDRKHILVQCVD